MEKKKIMAEVEAILRHKLGIEPEVEITPETFIRGEPGHCHKEGAGYLGADSLDFVELVMEFEKEFGLDTIPDDEAERLDTVEQVVDYIYGHQK